MVLLQKFSAIAIILGYASLLDFKKHKIQNWLTLSSILLGILFNFSLTSLNGILFSFYGIFAGFGLLIIPYSLNAMGAGDVKLLMAVGAWLGPWDTVQGFLWAGLIGGVLGLVGMMYQGQFRQRMANMGIAVQNLLALRPLHLGMDEEGLNKAKLPYAVPIALGYFAYFLFGGLV